MVKVIVQMLFLVMGLIRFGFLVLYGFIDVRMIVIGLVFFLLIFMGLVIGN